jgi:hypothetical protein
MQSKAPLKPAGKLSFTMISHGRTSEATCNGLQRTFYEAAVLDNFLT